MRIAFATRDGHHLDEQFRAAPRLVIYEVTAAGFLRHGEAAVSAAPGRRSEAKAWALAGCDVLYAAAIGPSSVARLVARGIQVATAPLGAGIEDLVRAHQAALAEGRAA